MATTMGSIDLKTFKGLRDDVTQYFWFESDSSATYGAGVHITLSPESTFKTSPTGQNILMNTDGISIRNGVLPMMALDNDSLDFNVVNTGSGTYTNVASFGATSTIGVSNGTQSYMYLDYRSLQMFDKEENVYFHLGDLLTVDGLIEYETIANGVDTMYRLPTYIQTPIDLSKTLVTVDGVQQTWGYGSARPYTVTDLEDSSYVEFLSGNIPQSNAVIFVKYEPMQGVETKYLTYGSRADNQAYGGFSSVFGENCSAIGPRTLAQGKGTQAFWADSVAFGKYNYQDLDTYFAFSIGNGTSNNARSNALTVDWSGNLKIAGSLFTNMTDEFAKGSGTNHVIIGGYHVCWGIESVTTSTSYSEVEVILPYTYSSVNTFLPFASIANRTAQARSAYATIKDESTLYIGAVATTSRTVNVAWLTIGT